MQPIDQMLNLFVDTLIAAPDDLPRMTPWEHIFG